MRRIRVIPTLLLDSNGGLVKTIGFGKRTYIGDPINAVRIFNDKGVDELVLLNIDATRSGKEANYQIIEDIVSEAFMPIGFGGGITTVDQMSRLFRCGLEKVIIGSAAHSHPDILREGSLRFGSQSIVVCMDVQRNWFSGYEVKTHSGTRRTKIGPIEYAKRAEQLGAGEVIVYSIDRDGSYKGYDVELLKSVASQLTIPVIACGGARDNTDFASVVRNAEVSAVAAGSMFIYQSSRRGVMINYPNENEMNQIFKKISES